MRLGTLIKSAIVFVPLLIICGARMHAQRTASPEMTQEVSRCLTVMRVATARRKTSKERAERDQLNASVRTDASAGRAMRPSESKTA